MHSTQIRVGIVRSRKETIMSRLAIAHNNLNSTLDIVGKHTTVFFVTFARYQKLRNVFFYLQEICSREKGSDGRNGKIRADKSEEHTGVWW